MSNTRIRTLKTTEHNNADVRFDDSSRTSIPYCLQLINILIPCFINYKTGVENKNTTIAFTENTSKTGEYVLSENFNTC